MNKKGFTLIELIAVVVIMAIIALIATPNIVNLVETSKKNDYINDAKIFISRAKAMEKQAKYQEKFTDGKICIGDLKNVSDFTSPYGKEYIKDSTNCSYVKIEITTGTSPTIQQKVASIYLHDGTGYSIGTPDAPITEIALDKDVVQKK